MSSIGGRSGSFVVPGGLVELGYVENNSSNVVVTAQTPATANSVIGPLTVVCDGSPVLVEFYSWGVNPDTVSSNPWISIGMKYDGTRQNGHFGYFQQQGTGYGITPTHLARRFTPSAGSHTFEIDAYVNTGSGAVLCDSAGNPMYLRVSKIVEQGTSLKPFWTPPIVTELPTNATLGDMVTLASANGNHRPAQYDGTDWQIMGVGSKPPSAQLWASSWNMASEGVGQQVTGFSAQWDNDSMTNTSDRITINTPGLYHANGAILTPTGTNTDYRCGLRITQFNSSNVQVLDVSHAGSYINIGWGKDRTVAGTFKCSEGDYLILRVDVDSSTDNTNMPFTAGRLTASFIGQA